MLFYFSIARNYPDIAKKTFQVESFLYSSTFFTLRANQYCWVGWGGGSRLVNNPGKINLEIKVIVPNPWKMSCSVFRNCI